MPHHITWTISPTSRVDADHCLHIWLDPKEIIRGLRTPPHNLEISFPRGYIFTPFKTVWCNAPKGFTGFTEGWGHDADPSGGRWYRISYHRQVLGDMQWDGQSPIKLDVTTRQHTAWLTTARGWDFAFDNFQMSEDVDCEICVYAPKPAGRWVHLCAKVLFHLNRPTHLIYAERLPILEKADEPVIDETNCSVKFHSSSARPSLLWSFRVNYSCGLLFGWLTGRSALLKALGLLIVVAWIVLAVLQFAS